MEIDHGIAEKVKVEHYTTQVSYMPFYTTNDEYWLAGCLWQTVQEAIDSVKHDPTIIKLRVMEIELPILNVPENVDL